MAIRQSANNCATSAQPDSYVFIVTYGRSGSTLLQSILNSIDGYCIRGENGGILPHLSRAYHDLKDSGPITGLRTAAKPSPVDHPWFGGECIDSDKLGASMCASFIDNVLALPAGTRVGGFKEIRYHALGSYLNRHLDFISQYFPNAKFVFNIRNLNDVANSGWWRERDRQEVIRLLGAADERFKEYIAANDSNSILMEYDTYKNDSSALESLYCFLGEEFDPSSVEGILNKKLTHLQPPPR